MCFESWWSNLVEYMVEKGSVFCFWVRIRICTYVEQNYL